MAQDRAALERLVAAQCALPVDAGVKALADAAAARWGAGVLAVVAYGSTLRGAGLDETLADLYVLTEGLADVSPSAWLRLGCRLVPPNVHYLEVEEGGRRLRAKVAVLPLARFAARMGADVSNPYFWARFSQPCRIVLARDEEVRARLVAAFSEAVRTMLRAGLSLAPAGADWRGIWEAALRATYGTELRPEGAARAEHIVERNEQWCRQTARAVLGEGFRAGSGTGPAAIGSRERIAGKALSVLRLAKAAFTFAGGAEYIAWKIERHSGVRITLSPWQKRHPLLAAVVLLPRLIRSGAVK